MFYRHPCKIFSVCIKHVVAFVLIEYRELGIAHISVGAVIHQVEDHRNVIIKVNQKKLNIAGVI